MPELHAYLTGSRGWPQRQESLVDEIEIDARQIAQRLTANFFARQSQRWLICFYEYVSKTKTYDIFKSTPLLRLANGCHIAPGTEEKPNAYMPVSQSLGETGDEFPQILQSLASNPKVNKFLRDTVKLREPNLVDVAVRCILPKYREDKITVDPESAEYESDLRKIAAVYNDEGLKPADRSRLFSELKVTRLIACRPVSEMAGLTEWTSPYDSNLLRRSTELEEWFIENSADSFWFPLDAAAEHLREILRQRPDALACLLRENPATRWDSFRRKHVKPIGGFDPDATLDGLDFAASHPTLERAASLWRILLDHPALVRGKWFESTRQDFPFDDRTKEKQDASALGKAVLHQEWLPKKGEAGFFRPSALYLEDLPDHAFEKDTPRAGALERILGMKVPMNLAPVAAELGKTQEQLQFLLSVTPEEAEELEELRQRRAAAQDFPEIISPSPERRRQNVKSQARRAPRRTSVQRVLKVPEDYEAIKEDGKRYLREQYRSGNLIVCQLAQKPMTFKVNGRDEWYFEAVECVPKPRKLYKENCLALSPHFAAMYQYANHDRERMRELILSATGREVQITLYDRTYSLRFTSQHLDDLRAVLEVDAEDAGDADNEEQH